MAITRNFCIALLALGLLSCVTKDTVTEQDRKVLYQSNQAWKAVSQIAAALIADPTIAVGIAPVLSEMADVHGIPLTEALLKVYGPPKEIPPQLSKKSTGDLIKECERSHSQPWWKTAGLTLLGAIPTLVLIASKFARFLPGGIVPSMAVDALVKGAEVWMERKKREGKPELAEDLAAVLGAIQENPKVKAMIDSRLKAVKHKLGIDPEHALLTSPPPTGAGGVGV